VAYIKNHSKF